MRAPNMPRLSQIHRAPSFCRCRGGACKLGKERGGQIDYLGTYCVRVQPSHKLVQTPRYSRLPLPVGTSFTLDLPELPICEVSPVSKPRPPPPPPPPLPVLFLLIPKENVSPLHQSTCLRVIPTIAPAATARQVDQSSFSSRLGDPTIDPFITRECAHVYTRYD